MGSCEVLAAAAETAAEGVSPREVKEKWAEAWQPAETTYAGAADSWQAVLSGNMTTWG